jgi:hypothetical protein
MSRFTHKVAVINGAGVNYYGLGPKRGGVGRR